MLMMERMSAFAHGTTAKILFVIIMISFSVWGVGAYVQGHADLDPAEVNGVTIPGNYFQSKFEVRKRELRQQLGSNYSKLASNEQFMQSQKEAVLNSMIDDELITQQVKKLGIFVGFKQVENQIKQFDEFKENGKFSQKKFQEVLLRTSYQNPTQFGEALRSDLQLQTYTNAFSNDAFALPYEVKQISDILGQKREVTVRQIPLSNVEESISVSDNEVSDYYKAHSSDYMNPESVKVSYVEITAKELAEKKQVAEDDIQKYYKDNQKKFTKKPTYHVAHIMKSVSSESDDAKAKADIDEIYSQLQNGAMFEELAKKNSDDKVSASKGGDLGVVEEGTEQPEFEEAVKLLSKDNVYSKPIKTKYGYHIIKFIDKTAGSVKPLAEVHDEIKRTLQNNGVEDAYAKLKSDVVDKSFSNPESLDSLEDLGLKVKTSEFFDKSTSVAPFSNQKLLNLAFSKEFRDANQNSELIEINDHSSIIIHPLEYKAASAKPLSEVKESVVESVKKNKAKTELMKIADNYLKNIKDEKATSELTEKYKIEVKEPEVLDRFSKEYGSEVSAEIFKMAKPSGDKKSTIKVYDQMGNLLIVTLNKVEQAEKSGASEDGLIQNTITQVNSGKDQRALISQLHADGKIKINQAALKSAQD